VNQLLLSPLARTGVQHIVLIDFDTIKAAGGASSARTGKRTSPHPIANASTASVSSIRGSYRLSVRAFLMIRRTSRAYQGTIPSMRTRTFRPQPRRRFT
jgi:hypothetical protein